MGGSTSTARGETLLFSPEAIRGIVPVNCVCAWQRRSLGPQISVALDFLVLCVWPLLCLRRIGGSLSPARGESFPWRNCRCIQISSKLPSGTALLDQLSLDLPNGLPKSQQLVDVSMVILPSLRESCCNTEVALDINNFSLGVDDNDVIINTKALGFYPYRFKLHISPQLGQMENSAIAIYDYNFHDGARAKANSSTLTTLTKNSEGEIGARLDLWPVSFILKKKWGQSLQEPMEYESISVGAPGNTAEIEWKLLRWNHNGKKYNPSKPYFEPPFRGGRTKINVEDFPVIVWHLPASTASKFQLGFNIRLEADMHLLWYERSSWTCPKAKKYISKRVEFSHEFVGAMNFDNFFLKKIKN
ncbi:uncharacterized protein LOC112350778 [Selaginella moellendorffii]|uniref:uncharacterized protein LOC112350778 n=1 Tax=Selaginella moellendorffii TaxID=88036 RepID=UPI000D1C3ED2|nr:uncharacterized protein LOC112350778 [Selaginella moellendorffii]|eukprot:XP_024543356.1 uncharacterized protein LOC112350778 [Selaginella moellendorffii]